MSRFRVIFSRHFSEKLAKSEKDFQSWVENILDQLAINPYVGKPLGTKWLREKKFGKKRMYYLLYEEFSAVYLVGISEKKDQPETIALIKLKLNLFRSELEAILKGGISVP